MKKENQIKRVLITGSTGFLGKSLIAVLSQETGYIINETNSKSHNLTILERCVEATKDIDIVINLAGLVPSRIEQKRRPAEVLRINTLINLNMAEAARINNVGRIIFVSSVTAYPENIPAPFSEKNLWDGPVPAGSYAYGIAKRFTETIAKAYADQYRIEANTIFLPNLYGPNDKFDNDPPPLIASIIKQIQKAIDDNEPIIHGGNNGEVMLDMLYIEDAAEAIKSVVLKNNLPPLLNISTGVYISIREMYSIAADTLSYKGSIEWQTGESSLPRVMDSTQAQKHLSWQSTTSFQQGIKNTAENFLGKKF